MSMHRDGKNFQPFLADLEHLETPRISFRLDGKEIYSQLLDTARYSSWIPMPAVKKAVNKQLPADVQWKVLQQGKVNRSPQLIANSGWICRYPHRYGSFALDDRSRSVDALRNGKAQSGQPECRLAGRLSAHLREYRLLLVTFTNGPWGDWVCCPPTGNCRRLWVTRWIPIRVSLAHRQNNRRGSAGIPTR